MRWFRMYAEAVDDPKLRLLAFEDRWHFVAILCMKSEGMIDEHADNKHLDRMVAAKLGLAARDADEVRRRLMDVDLIDEKWQPAAWGRRQYESDTSAARTRRWREKNQSLNGGKRHGDVTVTPPDTDTDTDTESEKKKKTGSRMARPSLEEVREYIQDRGSRVNPEAFHAYYESNGWKVGKSPMKSWKAAITTWEKRDEENRGSTTGPVRQTRAQRGDEFIRRLREGP